MKTTVCIAALLFVLPLFTACQEHVGCRGGGTAVRATIAAGDLTVEISDNGGSRSQLSGISSIRHADAPGFEPVGRKRCENAAANYEHVVSVEHSDARNYMAPRFGALELEQLDTQTVELRRPTDASPWGVGATLIYQVAPPHYVDLFFRCEVSQPVELGSDGALFFFASYLAGVVDPGLHFLADLDGKDTWTREAAPGSYRGIGSAPLPYPPGHNSERDLVAFDAPLVSEPFYYVQMAQGMVYALLLDRLVTETDEVRLVTLRGKAWDWSYVLHDLAAPCGFTARLVFKPFVSAADIEDEYLAWSVR